jgi:hypothetical protein
MGETDQLSSLVINKYKLNAIEANYLLENYPYACEIYNVLWIQDTTTFKRPILEISLAVQHFYTAISFLFFSFFAR